MPEPILRIANVALFLIQKGERKVCLRYSCYNIKGRQSVFLDSRPFRARTIVTTGLCREQFDGKQTLVMSDESETSHSGSAYESLNLQCTATKFRPVL